MLTIVQLVLYVDFVLSANREDIQQIEWGGQSFVQRSTW